MPGRIAIVDDDVTIRKLLLTLLEDRGYEVQDFGTIGEATEGLRLTPPDLLIVDVELPDGCGLDLVGSLRSETGRKVPAIVLSGMREENDFVRGFAAGAVDYLTKPFQHAELLARCAVHLARSCVFDAPSSPDVDLPTKDGLIFGRYRVKKELGRGGYGRVYLAHDTQRSEELVALKVLAPLAGEQPETRLRFIRETYTLASVRDPQRRPDSRRRDRAGSALLRHGVRRGRVARGLRAASEAGSTRARRGRSRTGFSGRSRAIDAAGLVHRDLKPENVILRGGKISDPVLIDFGLAKRGCDRGITDAHVLMGTVAYLSPEVIRGRDPDRRSDLFALGLTLRYALMAEELFPALRGVELMTAIATTPIPPATVPLSPDFAQLLTGLCQTNPDRRIPSPSVAIAKLRSLVGIRPSTRRVASKPRVDPSATERLAC